MMKRIILFLLVALSTLNASSQTWDRGFTFRHVAVGGTDLEAVGRPMLALNCSVNSNNFALLNGCMAILFYK